MVLSFTCRQRKGNNNSLNWTFKIAKEIINIQDLSYYLKISIPEIRKLIRESEIVMITNKLLHYYNA